ncbi:MAG: helix-turn-helix transcriptional regulator [Bacteroidia bacterium]|nr:helix-turn-helix transcriptional regulator [Bacteroidia bacterium]
MKHYNNPGIELTSKPRNTKLRNVTSLPDMNMKVKESKQDIVLNNRIDNKSALTNREHEIMEKLSEGLLYKEIADSLGLCLNTVKNHLKNIYPKLGAGNRSEAIIEYLIISDKIKKY